jgi:peptidoglycan/LPS O-acetylase OafA/YrhL
MFMGRTDIRVDHILWGVVVALAYADPIWRPRLHAWLANSRVTALLLLALAGLLFVYHVDWKLKFALLSIEGILVPLAIMSTTLNHSCRIGRLLELPLLRLIGRLSFSIYLWQQLFLVWSEARVPALAPWQALPLNLVALAACAAISFWMIEEPAIALGRKFLARWPALRQSSGVPLAVTTGVVKP